MNDTADLNIVLLCSLMSMLEDVSEETWPLGL